VVVKGRATFTLDGQEVDAPAGTIVHLPEPGVRRTAVAREPGTAVLAVGGKRGEPFQPSPWELAFRALRFEPREAVAFVEEHMAEYPDEGRTHYNLACFKALAGDREGALDALERAYAMDPDSVTRFAADDADLDSIRDDPRFAEVVRA
jgi:hypothetical protein